jgi:hypothetical protein
MKKLLAILVITVFAATAMVAVDNPFTFGLSAKFQGKFSDTSKAGFQSQASAGYDDDGAAEKPTLVADADNLFGTDNVSLKAELDASASTTIAEIYTLSFGITEKPEIAGATAANEVNFKIMGNSIAVIQDYLTIGLDIKYNLFHGTGAYAVSSTSVADSVSPIDTNKQGPTEKDPVVTSVSGSNGADQVTTRLDFVLSLSGSIPDTGFNWKLSSDNRLNFALAGATASDPVYSGYGTAASRDGNTAGFFTSFYTENKLELKWEFLHFFAPENITCTLIIDPVLKITVPYSYYTEQLKTLEIEMNPGVELGLAGFNVGLKCFIDTVDKLGESAPAGHAGSAYKWTESDSLGQDPEDSDTTGASATYNYEYEKDADNQGNNTYPWRTPSGTLKVGPKLTLGFTKGMGTFGFMWKGYAHNLRAVNWGGDNRNNSAWTNEFEIDVKIAF